MKYSRSHSHAAEKRRVRTENGRMEGTEREPARKPRLSLAPESGVSTKTALKGDLVRSPAPPPLDLECDDVVAHRDMPAST